MIIFKNILSFGLTFKAYDWFIVSGVKDTMLPISIVQVVICLLSVPMCKLPIVAMRSVRANRTPRCVWKACQSLLS